MCIEALKANSDKFKVFCLVHKMDLVPVDVRASVFAKQVPSTCAKLSSSPHALNKTLLSMLVGPFLPSRFLLAS
jgi:hypothetical protein